MRILFIHQNFPGQFKNLAPALVEQGHDVRALGLNSNIPNTWCGIRYHCYSIANPPSPTNHPWLSDFEPKLIRGEACYIACTKLADDGFTPDLIIAHHGWGESMFLKDIWPSSKLAIYCEFYYRHKDCDIDFDPEFSSALLSDPRRIRIKNLNNLIHFNIADAGISPTTWQADSFPESFRSKITVIHDGIDTNLLKPDDSIQLQLSSGIALSANDEVITFVNRNLEPYRGYHTFMRSLPYILNSRPDAHVLIIGGDGVSYGSAPHQGTWKNIFASEVKATLTDSEWSRIHFMGNVPYNHYVSILKISSVHVYLTYPFVLSWSLLEAMSIGCSIVASDTPPLHECIFHNETGILTPFFDQQKLAENISYLLDNPDIRTHLGTNARKFACKNYDLSSVCLPKQVDWVNYLLNL